MQGRAMPPGNEVVMAPDGTASGELREHVAIAPVMQLRSSGGRENLGLDGVEPQTVTPAQRAADIAVMQEGLKLCASYGFTALHNMDGNRYQLDRSITAPGRPSRPFSACGRDMAGVSSAVPRRG